ncbi:MAG: glycosyltransferase [Eubacterium sp.]|nr:glycosyltransferase [Eubacterium sp.]
MRFLICEWSGYMQDDLEDCLHSLGIDTVEYGYRILNFDRDDYFYRRFDRILDEETVDAVMMMNYIAPLAELCAKHQIPYISWVYDCPFGLKEPEKTLGLPTNHIFFFDREQAGLYQRKGFQTVDHLPLAVNANRIDGLLREGVSGEDPGMDFKAEVSFVGILYDNKYHTVKELLPDQHKKELDEIVDNQIGVYTDYRIKDRLRRAMNPDWREFFKGISDVSMLGEEAFYDWMEHTLAKKVTREERIQILSGIGAKHKTALYSPAGDDRLSDVEFRGIVSAYDTAPLVYHHSKINLNITLKDIVSGISLRVFEILGAGGFLLSNRQPEIEEYFRDGEEVVLYDSIEDCINKASYYLEHEDERCCIAAKGRKAVERFSFEKQVGEIIKRVFGKEIIGY